MLTVLVCKTVYDFTVVPRSFSVERGHLDLVLGVFFQFYCGRIESVVTYKFSVPLGRRDGTRLEEHFIATYKTAAHPLHGSRLPLYHEHRRTCIVTLHIRRRMPGNYNTRNKFK